MAERVVSKALSVRIVVELSLMVVSIAGCHAEPPGADRLRYKAETISDLAANQLVIPEVRGAPGSGAQALAAIMAFYDRELNAADIAEALPWHDFEATEEDLIVTARKNGFDGQSRRGTWEELVRIVAKGCPVIVRVRNEATPGGARPRIATTTLREWVVVASVRSDSIEIARERDQLLRMGRHEFLKHWKQAGQRMVVIQPVR